MPAGLQLLVVGVARHQGLQEDAALILLLLSGIAKAGPSSQSRKPEHPGTLSVLKLLSLNEMSGNSRVLLDRAEGF